jgi:[ribosomal protein S5]-alanine N-acetyltransferase
VDSQGDHETLLTARLELRRPREEDVGLILAIHADPRTTRHNPSDMLAERSDAFALYRRWDDHWRRHGFGYWMIEEAGSGRALGFCGVKRMRLHGVPVLNLLYRLHPRAWGRGVASEAAARVVEWAAHTHPTTPLIARVRPDNAASHRVAARVGLQRRPDLDADGEDGPDWIYIGWWTTFAERPPAK